MAIVAGTLLPYLAARDQRLLKPTTEKDDVDSDSEDEEDADMDRIREMVREWKAEAARHGRPLKLPTSKFDVQTILSQCPSCCATFGRRDSSSSGSQCFQPSSLPRSGK